MAKFGNSSSRRLNTAHPALQRLFLRVVMRRDCSITDGHRDEIKQNFYFEKGTSKVQWPNSKHNSNPSLAVDCVPWPEKWSSVEAFDELKEIVWEEWAMMKDEGLTDNFNLVWGGDWKSFCDRPHWELR